MDQFESEVFQDLQKFFFLVQPESPINAVVPVKNRDYSAAVLEHQLQYPSRLEHPCKLGNSGLFDAFWVYMLDNSIAYHEVEMAVRKSQGFFKICHTHPAGNLGVSNPGFLDVVRYRVYTMDIKS